MSPVVIDIVQRSFSSDEWQQREKERAKMMSAAAFALCLCAVPVALVLFKLLRIVGSLWWQSRKLQNLAPEPGPRHWLRGHFPGEERDFVTQMTSQVAKYSRLYHRLMGPFLTLLHLVHPDEIADVVKAGCPKEPFIYQMLKPWLGEGLLLSEGKRWMRDRKLINHTFSISMLRGYVSVYKDACSTLLEKWSSACANTSGSVSINISEAMRLLSFDIILRCAMGINSNCQLPSAKDSPQRRYLDTLQKIMKETASRFRKPLHFIDSVYFWLPSGRMYRKLLDEAKEYSMMVIQERREYLQTLDGDEDEDVGDTMLDNLITIKDEDGYGLTDEEIRNQIDTFLQAGQDTTSTALQWTLHFLSIHENIQNHCREEVLKVVESVGGWQNLSYDDLSGLEYVTWTIQETLRLISVASSGVRITDRPTRIGNVDVPSGARCVISILEVHRNPEVWPDPLKFDPGRFSPARKPSHPYAFIPFSAGARSCIGRYFAMDKMRTVLSGILASFRIKPDPNAPEVYPHITITTKPTPYVQLLFEPL